MKRVLLMFLGLVLIGCGSSQENIVMTQYEHFGYSYTMLSDWQEKNGESNYLMYSKDDNLCLVQFHLNAEVDATNSAAYSAFIDEIESNDDMKVDVNEKQLQTISNDYDVVGVMAPLTSQFNDMDYKGFMALLTHKQQDAILILFFVNDGKDYQQAFESIANSVKATTTSESASSEKDTKSTTKKKTTKKKTKKKTSKIDPKFKKSMDDYEKFMKKYVKFIKKYENSDDSISMLSDYTDMLSEYTKMTTEFDSVDTNKLNDEELAYYIDVQARVTKLLLEISN